MSESRAESLREQLRAPVEDLTARLDPAALGFARTDELHPLEAVFGQERAVRAIEFSLGMEGSGYSLYAAGPDGFGKHTVVEAFLRRRSAVETDPSAGDLLCDRLLIQTTPPPGSSEPARARRARANRMPACRILGTLQFVQLFQRGVGCVAETSPLPPGAKWASFVTNPSRP